MIYLLASIIFLIGFLVLYDLFYLQNHPEIERQKFHHKFYDWIYVISYLIPFSWFVENGKDLTEKGKKTKDLLQISRIDRKFTVRSFMAFKVLILFSSMTVGFLVLILYKTVHLWGSFLLQVEVTKQNVNLVDGLMIFMLFLSLGLIPNVWLKYKAKQGIVSYNRDIPSLQMFVILMLRSNKSVGNILYGLSKMNTYHKSTFQKAYRIFMRNPQEGLEHLKQYFKDSQFSDTIELLRTMNEYEKSNIVEILEDNLNNIVREAEMVRRKNDMSKLVYSQASIAVPFIGILALGALPIVYFALQMFVESFSGAF